MTIRDLYRSMTDSFSNVSDSADIDARALICHALGIDYTHFMLNMNETVPSSALETLEAYKARREQGEPVAYITGERGFYECIFHVSPATLIPRADTEILVENAIEDIKKAFPGKKEISIMDLCCGTGCIGISVAKVLSRTFEKVSLTLSDLSKDALEVCFQNVKDLIKEPNIETELCCGSLFETVEGKKYDAILTNPPYIATNVIENLDTQVRQYEPHLALDGGEDGLDLVKEIAENAPRFLNKEGLLFMEIGYDQGLQTQEIFTENGFSGARVIRDYGDCDRLVKGQLK